MWIIIADDLTGAAEAAALGLPHGLSAEVQLDILRPTDADVVALDTDTRSRAPREAAERIAALAGGLYGQKVYKKVDSVLRGNIRAELERLLSVTGARRALLVPANPAIGRTVRDGRYYVRGIALDETDFAHDPEHPAHTSDVIRMLGVGSQPLHVARPGAPLPSSGIVVGEASTPAELERWAASVDADTLPAGAAAFFGALMQRGELALPVAEPSMIAPHRRPALFVCGSSSAGTRTFVASLELRGVPVLRMPDDLFSAEPPGAATMARWTDATAEALARTGLAAVAIARPNATTPGLPYALSRRLSDLVASLTRLHLLRHLYVEGGATASAIVRSQGWRSLAVRESIPPGAVTLQPTDDEAAPALTMKPGSYPWPESIARASR